MISDVFSCQRFECGAKFLEDEVCVFASDAYASFYLFGCVVALQAAYPVLVCEYIDCVCSFHTNQMNCASIVKQLPLLPLPVLSYHLSNAHLVE